MLRGTRFAARFGFAIERSTAEAIRSHAKELKGVSRERIGEEIKTMLLDHSYLEAATLIETLGLAPQVFDDELSNASLTHLATLCSDDLWVRLAAWLLDRHAPSRSIDVAAVRHALMLSNEATAGVSQTLQVMEIIKDRWNTMGVAARKRLAAGQYFQGGLALMATVSSDDAHEIQRDVTALLETGPLAPPPLLTGNDLLSSGCLPGPSLGEMLEAVYDAQLEGRVTTWEEAMAFVLPPS